MESFISFFVLGALIVVVVAIIGDALGFFFNTVIRKLLEEL